MIAAATSSRAVFLATQTTITTTVFGEAIHSGTRRLTQTDLRIRTRCNEFRKLSDRKLTSVAFDFVQVLIYGSGSGTLSTVNLCNLRCYRCQCLRATASAIHVSHYYLDLPQQRATPRSQFQNRCSTAFSELPSEISHQLASSINFRMDSSMPDFLPHIPQIRQGLNPDFPFPSSLSFTHAPPGQGS